MAKLVLDKEIENISVPWDSEQGAYPGSRIEEFIKKQFQSKAGFIARSSEKETDGNYHLRGFYSEETYNEWASDNETYATNVLFDVALPAAGSSTAASYIVQLVNGSDKTMVVTDKNTTVKLRFTSQVYNPSTQQTTDTDEMGRLTIQTKLEGATAWSTKATLTIESMPADSTDWIEVNIGQYLSMGQQQVRIICRGETTELATTYVSYSITLTNLSLTFASTWELPFNSERIPLSYYVTGNIAKDLIVRVTGTDYDQTFTRSLGTNVYTETPYILEIDSPGKHGVYTVSAYLASGTAVKTETLESQIMVTTEEATGILMAINNVNKSVINWNTAKFLEWAIYNPAAATTPVTIRLMNDDLSEAYITSEIPEATSGVKYEFTEMVEIETGEDAPQTVNGRLTFYSGSTELRKQLLFVIDNSADFSPTKGAAFILNPKQRSNNEANPQTIFNEATGAEVASTWTGFEWMNDGWITDADGARCLRVLAGKRLAIDYESFSINTGQTQENSLTIEIDFASRNATDLVEPIIQMCSTYASDNKPLGLQIRPQEAHFLTTGHRAEADQDVMFQEDVRTHMAINIIYNLGGNGISYVRIFINGIINREFIYTDTDKFIQMVEGVYTSGGIRIGSSTSDVDIYGIRIYKKAMSATDIRQDYMASLLRIEDKKAFMAANDIMVNNQINYERASLLYNTMLWTGDLPYILDQSSKKGDLTINILGDPSHSGTITGMSVKGQGSSSKKYYLWNHQYGFGDGTWIDGNGKDRGKSYQLTDDVPAATKLVAKLNWASSQQSHKLGSCDMYQDVWKEVVGGNSITATEGYENVRVCVKQKPFLMFQRPYEGADPVFYGLVTFGPGKGDKPTFGYDKSIFPDYLMIEGSDNGAVLTLHQVPWNEDVEESIDDEGELEGWKYNGIVSWDYDLGKESSISYFIPAFNFIYLCSNRISPFVGNFTAMQAAAADLDKSRMYWITVADSNHAKYDLFRYDWITSQWVDAGVTKLDAGKYEILNLRSQLDSYLSNFESLDAVINQIWAEVNEVFINARVKMFAAGIGEYYNLSDARFTMMMMKLLGASDNRAKNTYQYIDPVSHKICFAQDDMDTIFTTDNSGRKDKPYYVEEHDLNTSGKMYWNGEVNTFYNLMELAFPAELRSTMKAIFAALAKLGGSPMGAFEKYYFWVQKYFPAVAYNETARLLYETAEQKTNEGLYNPPSVSAISQSLGDQLQCEMQFLNMRTTYLASFCSYGDFSVSSSKSISFRSRYTKDGRQPTYTFKLRPFMWIYPTFAVGQSLSYGSDATGKSYALPQRVKAGEEYTISFITDNDTPCALLAPDCYASIGNWGDKPLTGEFALSGKRLTEFSAGFESDVSTVEFNASSFKVSAANIKRLNLSNVEGLTGVLDLSKLSRSVTIDVKGTAVSSVELPKTGSLENLYLPAKMTSLRVDGQPGLIDTSVEGVSNMQTIYVDQAKAGQFNSQQLATLIYGEASPELANITMLNVAWNGITADALMYLCDKSAVLTGNITMMPASQDRNITFAEKLRLVNRYGDIDSDSSTLFISYTVRAINSMTVQGETYIYQLGEYAGLSIKVLPSSANNFKVKDGKPDITWGIDQAANTYAEFTDVHNGILNVKKLSDPLLKEKFTITVSVNTMDGNTLTQTKQVGFFRRIPELGDFAYVDGTFDDVYDQNKELAGLVVIKEKLSDTKYRLVVDAAEDLILKTSDGTEVSSLPWGLYADSAATNGFPSEITTAICEACNISSATDLPLKNITKTGAAQTTDPSGNPSPWYINEDNFMDSNTDDGYAVYDADGAFSDFAGKENTAVIVEHAKQVLLNYLDVPLPTNTTELADAMYELSNANGNAKKYWQFWYPAAYGCVLYEPKGENIDPQYAKGNWYLKAEGEQARVYNFYHNSRGRIINATPSRTYANESPENEAKTPLFANVLQRVYDVNQNAKPYTQYAGTYYWCSTEYNGYNSWYVNFGNGSTNSSNKFYTHRVRPAVEYEFNL